tara:strand:- start:478 stop:618 length:141 start_codon:yes stop_codon:yes gene_type:complete
VRLNEWKFVVDKETYLFNLEEEVMEKNNLINENDEVRNYLLIQLKN